MRKPPLLIIFLLILIVPYVARSQQPYWQQQVNYIIDVALNDKEHSLDAFARIEYINNSPDTIKFIWFHFWPNAYKTDKTAYSEQDLENGSTDFYFSDKEERGYINRLDFKVNNVTAELEDHPQHIDIAKLVLPSPLPPGEKITITTPFHVKLPFNFSRGGHDGESYQVTQWYPKPAVYDRHGWHPMPYLNLGEFYSEFGNYDVRITVPENYVVAATGKLQNAEEKEWLQSRAGFDWKPVTKKTKTKGGIIKKTTERYPASSTHTKTLKFIQENVHDFAWFADKRFIVNQDTCRLASGKTIDVFTFYTPEHKKLWANSIQHSKDAVRSRSDWIGDYPYDVVSVVQGPESFAGGMEYPSITIITPVENEALLDFTIAHEIGHNWFYGAVASNERLHAWMDEGINTFYDNRYSDWKYAGKGFMQFGSKSVTIEDLESIAFESVAAAQKDQPIELPAHEYTDLNYNLIAYYKTGAWMELLEKHLGKNAFDDALQEYYRQWNGKHPYPEDFKKVLETKTGQDLDSFFALHNRKGLLPDRDRQGWKLASPLKPSSIGEYIANPSKQLLLVSPAIGFNSYDRAMPGILLTNYKLPMSRFQFLLLPMYSTGAKKLVGFGKLSYSLLTGGKIRKTEFFVNASSFTQDKFVDPDGRNIFYGFQKLVPGFKLSLKENSPRSTRSRWLQWKSFFINEEMFSYSRDTIISGTDSTFVDNFGKRNENRVLNQLKLVTENYRALYPYSAELSLQQGKDFYRTAFTGRYFFNYSKIGGLDLRVFAGKFFYSGSKTISKQFSTDRYHLNMTGPDGFEDYTYSDVFLGRNRFEGMASQQIMERDGFFKVRTNLLSSKVGKIDDWLMAANFSSTTPLPILKVFADIGTYADAWEKDAELDRFLFDAGFQVSILKGVVNIYVPIIYSTVFKDYIQSTIPANSNIFKSRLFKTISFNIDVSHFDLKKIAQQTAQLW